MRIAYLTTSMVPSMAANSVQVMKMSRALGALGHDVTLYAAYGDLDRDPFDVYGVERCFELRRAKRPDQGKLGATTYLMQQTGALWQGPKADLYYGRAARFLLAVAARGGALGYEAHVLPDRGPRRHIQKALFALPRFRSLVCISESLRDDYLKAFPSLDSRKVIVAHDGADVMDLQEGPPPEDWPARPSAFQVGYVGGIYPGRGIETLLEVARQLPEVDFQIFGGNPETLAHWLEQSPPANFHLHGHIEHANLPNIYPHLDALLAPYSGEPVSVHGGGGNIGRWMSPLKIFEYMSTGRPIICSDLPVLREVLRDGDNALMPPAGDVTSWVQTITSLAEDRERAKRIGEAGLSDLRTHYTWTRRAERIVQSMTA